MPDFTNKLIIFAFEMAEQYTKDKLDSLKKWSKKFRIVVISVTTLLILSMWLMFKLHSDAIERQRIEEEARLAEQYRIEQIQQAERDREMAQQVAIEQAIADSIRIANMPSYTLDEVKDMVMKVAPSYSWVYLWRKDNDNWIMQYRLEYGNKEHCMIQRFNPTTRKFEKAIEVSTVSYPDLTEDGVYTAAKNCRCSFTEDNVWGRLTYYEDGQLVGVYSRDGIESICRIPSTTHGPLRKKRLRALESAPPEWKEEGYESAEDYYYDNAEDLYFYYGGEY